MGSDFSALDAELASLGEGPTSTVDVLQLARDYAGPLVPSEGAPLGSALSAVDDALAELEAARSELFAKRQGERAERVERVRRSTTPPPLPSRRPVAAARAPESEEIVLPEPVEQAGPSAHGSGELPLQASSSRSGAFAREHAGKRLGHDDTLEPFDDELEESDAHLVEFSNGARAPSGAPQDALGERGAAGGPLFDLAAPRDDAAQLEADAAFAELFSEATHQSIMPSARDSQAPEQYSDDTETFDSSSLGFVEDSAAAANTVSDEELDSAEFEIVMDADQESAPSVPPQRPAEPEKRPSFLGRLFGRKED